MEGRGHVGACPSFTTNVEPSIELGTADCDDDDDEISPGAIELCDGVDDDCDGWLAGADEELDADFDERDRDGDGFLECAASFLERDCADDDPRAFPGQDEYFVDAVRGVGGYDFNCNGFEELATTARGGCYPIFEDSAFRCEFFEGWNGTFEIPCGEAHLWVVGCAGADPAYTFPCFNTESWSVTLRFPECR